MCVYKRQIVIFRDSGFLYFKKLFVTFYKSTNLDDSIYSIAPTEPFLTYFTFEMLKINWEKLHCNCSNTSTVQIFTVGFRKTTKSNNDCFNFIYWFFHLIGFYFSHHFHYGEAVLHTLTASKYLSLFLL